MSAVEGYHFRTVAVGKKERKVQYANLDRLMKAGSFKQKYFGLLDGRKKRYYHEEVVVSAQPYEMNVKQGNREIACSGLEIRVSDDLNYPRRMNHKSEIPMIAEKIHHQIVKPSYENEENSKKKMVMINAVKQLNPKFK